MASVYLDSSVFFAILKADASEKYAGSIQGLFAELSLPIQASLPMPNNPTLFQA